MTQCSRRRCRRSLARRDAFAADWTAIVIPGSTERVSLAERLRLQGALMLSVRSYLKQQMRRRRRAA